MQEQIVNETGWFGQVQKWVYLACAPYGNRAAMRDVYTYLWMRSFSDAESKCWPSLETIAIDSGLSPSTIGRAVANLIEIGAIDKKWRQSTNLYTVRSTPPKGVSVRPQWPSQNRVAHRSQVVNMTIPDGQYDDPRSSNRSTSKSKVKEKVGEEKEMARPSRAATSDKDEALVYRDSENEGGSTLRRSKREPRVIPSGYIKKAKAPQRGNLYLAQQFAERASVGLTDWVWQLTSSSPNDPSKTNDPALAKIIGTWKDQHGWTDKEVLTVIDKFVSMVSVGRIRVNDKTVEPWRVFVSNIDKVIAAQKDTSTKHGTAEGWVKQVLL